MKKLPLALLLAATLAAAGPSGYRLVRTLATGGEGGWDYLAFDAGTERLFVTRGTRVDVVDPKSGKVLGSVPDTPGVHGVALDGAGRGFASDGRAGTVTVFDTKSLRVEKTVKVTGENPDAIVYDPATRRVFTMNGRSGNVTAIDAATLEPAGTATIGGKLEFAVADGKGTIWVNVEDKSELAAFDARTLEVKRRVPLAPCEEPTGLAIDPAARRLFSGCGNALLAVTDTDAGKVVQTLPIGHGCDGVAFDAGTVLASNGDGTLTVIRQEGGTYAVVENVPTQRSARTLAVDPRTHEVFLSAAKFAPPAPGERRGAMEKGSFAVLVLGK